MADQTPKKTDVVQVTPVTTPVQHGGELHRIGETIEGEWRHLEHLVEAGIARLEKIVGKGGSSGKASKGSGTDAGNSGSGQAGE